MSEAPSVHAKSICSVAACLNPVRGRGLCNKHYLRAWTKGTLDAVAPLPDYHARFWAKVAKSEACWWWMAYRDRKGYGRFVAPELQDTLAHRIAYELLVGRIPSSLTLDHLCRNPPCVNPAHLEPVTVSENVLRGNPGLYNAVKTHCKRGHEFTPENTMISPGHRACLVCHKASMLEYRSRLRLARSHEKA